MLVLLAALALILTALLGRDALAAADQRAEVPAALTAVKRDSEQSADSATLTPQQSGTGDREPDRLQFAAFTLDGASALIILSVESPHLLRIGDRTGHSQPAHRTAVGRVLLSRYPIAEALALLDRAGHRIDEELIAVGAERLRVDGFLQQHGEAEAGISAVAVPVNAQSRIEYALSVTYPTNRIEPATVPRLAKAMTQASARLEVELLA